MRGMQSTQALAFLVIFIPIAAAQTAQDTSSELSSIRAIFDSPLALQAAQASTVTLSNKYVVAHFPYGGGVSTRVMLANNSKSPATVDVSFFQQSGAPALVPLDGEGTQSTMQLTIGPNQVQVIGADPAQRNAGAVLTWATVASSTPLNVFSLFDFESPAKGLYDAVGGPSTAAAKTFRFPVSVGGPLTYNAGIAVANPNASATTVTVKLLNADGSTKGSIQKNLPANGQTAFVVTEPGDFSLDLSQLFNGSIAVCASQPVGLLAIGGESGVLFSTAVTNDPCP